LGKRSGTFEVISDENIYSAEKGFEIKRILRGDSRPEAELYGTIAE
jgi:hypothetical protein